MLPKALEDGETKFIIRDPDGNELPSLLAETPLAKGLSGLVQVMDDLQHAKRLAGIISSVEIDDIKYSLWMSAIVTYGKCFARAKGRKTKLEEHHVSKIGASEFTFHKELISLRNEFFAHAGINNNEHSSIVIILSSAASDTKEVVGLKHINVKQRSISNEFADNFCKLCTDLYQEVEQRADKSRNKIFKEYQSMDVANLYEQTDEQT